MTEEQAAPQVEIHVRPDGSFKVFGPVALLDVDGNPYDLTPHTNLEKGRARIKLCRCGASKQMPFCDESHGEAGFRSCPRVTDLTETDQEERTE